MVCLYLGCLYGIQVFDLLFSFDVEVSGVVSE